MTKKLILITSLIFLSFGAQLINAGIYIYATVNDEIITNHDVLKESEYLKILNPSLKQLKDDQVLKLAKNSLVNEIVKKKEISKFISIDKDNPFVENYLKNLYSKLNYNNEEEFKKELKKKNNYTLDQIKQKLKIELFWNELIYSKYNNQLKIDKEEMLKKIDTLKDKNQKEYFLSEIVFNKKKGQTLNNLIEKIKLSINEIGFNNTANIFSVADSSKFGGKLGWVNENSLSKQVSNMLRSIDQGKYTDVIKLGNRYLIIKIDEIRINEIKIDKKKELEKLIQTETNKQLNQFSRIYFEKSKMNYSINEK